jgi:hypothetical protein
MAVIEDPRVPEGMLYLRPVPPACPNCGRDNSGDFTALPDGDHVVILESPMEWATSGEMQRGAVKTTVTQEVRFAWCSTIDRSTLP